MALQITSQLKFEFMNRIIIIFIDINECLTSFPCQTGQLCANTEGSYMCMCPDGSVVNSEGACVKGIYA